MASMTQSYLYRTESLRPNIKSALLVPLMWFQWCGETVLTFHYSSATFMQMVMCKRGITGLHMEKGPQTTPLCWLAISMLPLWHAEFRDQRSNHQSMDNSCIVWVWASPWNWNNTLKMSVHVKVPENTILTELMWYYYVDLCYFDKCCLVRFRKVHINTLFGKLLPLEKNSPYSPDGG